MLLPTSPLTWLLGGCPCSCFRLGACNQIIGTTVMVGGAFCDILCHPQCETKSTMRTTFGRVTRETCAFTSFDRFHVVAIARLISPCFAATQAFGADPDFFSALSPETNQPAGQRLNDTTSAVVPFPSVSGLASYFLARRPPSSFGAQLLRVHGGAGERTRCIAALTPPPTCLCTQYVKTTNHTKEQ